MLDTQLPRKKIFMRLPAKDRPYVPEPALPRGYSFTSYRPGRCTDWARIETSVGEFDTEEAAAEYFRLLFLAYPRMAEERVLFVLNPEGVAVATASAWFGYNDGRTVPMLHWVAAHLSEQGNGLGTAVSSRALQLVNDEGSDVWLTTQTWSHVAIRIYDSLGFRLCKKDRIAYDAVDDGRVLMRQSPNEYEEAMAVLGDVLDAETLTRMKARAV